MPEPTQQTIAYTQHTLNKEGCAVPDLVVDGLYGSKTQAAIDTFRGLREMAVAHGAITDDLLDYFCEGLGMDSQGDLDWPTLFKALYPGVVLDKQMTVVHDAEGVVGDFIPLGYMQHHTAGPRGREHCNVNMLIKGRTGVPGPLCNFATSRDGMIDFITNGRTHNAGKGDSVIYNRMLKGTPVTDEGPLKDDMYGNTRFYGCETDHSGQVTEDVPAEQAHNDVRLAAMVCYAWRWDPHVYVIGHYEWTQRKQDPICYDMALFRESVQSEVLRIMGGVSPLVAPDSTAKGGVECPHCGENITLTAT